MTGKELLTPWMEESSSVHKAESKPNDTELRLLFGVAVSDEVRYIMSNHSYRYSYKTLLQSEGQLELF